MEKFQIIFCVILFFGQSWKLHNRGEWHALMVKKPCRYAKVVFLGFDSTGILFKPLFWYMKSFDTLREGWVNSPFSLDGLFNNIKIRYVCFLFKCF